MLSLNLRALAGQLLLLVRERLLHEHHSNTLFHGVFLGLVDVQLLVACELRQADKNVQARRLQGRAYEDRTGLADVVDRLLHKVPFHIYKRIKVVLERRLS